MFAFSGDAKFPTRQIINSVTGSQRVYGNGVEVEIRDLDGFNFAAMASSRLFNSKCESTGVWECAGDAVLSAMSSMALNLLSSSHTHEVIGQMVDYVVDKGDDVVIFADGTRVVSTPVSDEGTHKWVASVTRWGMPYIVNSSPQANLRESVGAALTDFRALLRHSAIHPVIVSYAHGRIKYSDGVSVTLEEGGDYWVGYGQGTGDDIIHTSGERSMAYQAIAVASCLVRWEKSNPRDPYGILSDEEIGSSRLLGRESLDIMHNWTAMVDRCDCLRVAGGTREESLIKVAETKEGTYVSNVNHFGVCAMPRFNGRVKGTYDSYDEAVKAAEAECIAFTAEHISNMMNPEKFGPVHDPVFADDGIAIPSLPMSGQASEKDTKKNLNGVSLLEAYCRKVYGKEMQFLIKIRYTAVDTQHFTCSMEGLGCEAMSSVELGKRRAKQKASAIMLRRLCKENPGPSEELPVPRSISVGHVCYDKGSINSESCLNVSATTNLYNNIYICQFGGRLENVVAYGPTEEVTESRALTRYGMLISQDYIEPVRAVSPWYPERDALIAMGDSAIKMMCIIHLMRHGVDCNPVGGAVGLVYDEDRAIHMYNKYMCHLGHGRARNEDDLKANVALTLLDVGLDMKVAYEALEVMLW
jgi:hypothetical protein